MKTEDARDSSVKLVAGLYVLILNVVTNFVTFFHRILKMMHTISSHAHENRMTPSAVAACMAPLLLRPLLAGECELEDDFDINGDSSAQLLAAANAANNAQAIITTLLEEYESIFDVRYSSSSSFLIKRVEFKPLSVFTFFKGKHLVCGFFYCRLCYMHSAM